MAAILRSVVGEAAEQVARHKESVIQEAKRKKEEETKRRARQEVSS